MTLNGGTLQSTADFTLNSNRGIALGTSHGTINVGNGTTLSYNGIASSNGNLTKSGTGTLVFGGANSYTGDTIIVQNLSNNWYVSRYNRCFSKFWSYL